MRARVIGWNVQPVVMLDDGDNLTPVSVSPQMIPAPEWERFKDGGDLAAIDGIRKQLDTDRET